MNSSPRITSNNYSHPQRPLPVALANQIGRGLSQAGLRADLSLEPLLHAAQVQAGLQDYGDQTFRAPLNQLLFSMEHEAQLHPLGRLMARQNLLRILVNRLRIEALLAQQPHIRQRPLPAPVFIVGLQRTGTTLLHRLLACDPSFRFLASWEAINPAPWPPPRSGLSRWLPGSPPADYRPEPITRSPDPRVKAARLAERSLSYLAPDFFAIHPVEADAPEEDCLLYDYTFYSTVPEATQRVPSFSRWLEQQDHLDAYRYVQDVLRLLDWQRPGQNWLLKTPHHMEHLDILLEVFPDARIIQPHRDPVQALASFCSMVSHGRGLFSDEVDPREVGSHWSRKAHRMVDHSMAVRASGREEAFIDVAYQDLVARPMEVMEGIYAELHRPLTEQTVARMKRWIPKNPQHKHGRHSYRLEDFGLDPEHEAQGFATYIKRHQIPRK